MIRIIAIIIIVISDISAQSGFEIATMVDKRDLSGQLRKKKKFFFDSISGYDVINKIFVKDVQKNHTTTLTMEDIKVDTGLDHSLFQEKNLKRMPRN